MKLLGEVQLVRADNEYRDKSGTAHAVGQAVVVDKGVGRVAGVGLCVSADRDRDPETYKMIKSLKQDEMIEMEISDLRFVNGEYRLGGTIKKVGK